jgi:hypothetical protein
MSNIFKDVEVKPKCFFCSAEGELTKEYMGNTWSIKWTCPQCGIQYRVGKSSWNGARCLYITIDPGEDPLVQKTAEWERAGHQYHGPPKNPQFTVDMFRNAFDCESCSFSVMNSKEESVYDFEKKQICPICGAILTKKDLPHAVDLLNRGIVPDDRRWNPKKGA